MTKQEDALGEAQGMLASAERLIPSELLHQLPPSPELDGAAAWYPFEHKIWELGETLRHHLVKHPNLRRDKRLQGRILGIAMDRRALRGRQSFVMLLGYKACVDLASSLAREIEDPTVDGQVIATLYRMKAHGFSFQVRPFVDHPKTWIRNEAKRYVAWDRSA